MYPGNNLPTSSLPASACRRSITSCCHNAQVLPTSTALALRPWQPLLLRFFMPAPFLFVNIPLSRPPV